MKHVPTISTIFLSCLALTLYVGYRTLAPMIDEDNIPIQTSNIIKSMPDFTLNDIDGNPISISRWKDKHLIINFWATWCAPCLREIPLLKDHQSQGGPTQVIGIAVDRLEPVKAFIEEMDFNYPILIGQTDAIEVAKTFGINIFALPLTFFITKDGLIVDSHVGELLPLDLELGLKKLDL